MKNILILTIITFFSFCVFSIEEFEFKKSVEYTVEYQTSDNKTEIKENMYYQKEWDIQIFNEQNIMDNKDGRSVSNVKRWKKYIVFLQADREGKRELHLINLEKIIRISLVTLQAKIENTNQQVTEDKLDITIK